MIDGTNGGLLMDRQARALRPDELRATCDAAALPFASTAELAPLVSQERAQSATAFGIAMRHRGDNCSCSAGADGQGVGHAAGAGAHGRRRARPGGEFERQRSRILEDLGQRQREEIGRLMRVRAVTDSRSCAARRDSASPRHEELVRAVVAGAIREPMRELRESCAGIAAVARDLDAVETDLVARAENFRRLMLREDVVEAVRAGRFHVHTVADVDAGLALLSGREAGARTRRGSFRQAASTGPWKMRSPPA